MLTVKIINKINHQSSAFAKEHFNLSLKLEKGFKRWKVPGVLRASFFY